MTDRRTFGAALAASLLGATAPAWAQGAAYPHRPIRIVVPFAPGGGGDAVVRSIVERFRGQTVVMSQNEIHPRAKLKTLGQV